MAPATPPSEALISETILWDILESVNDAIITIDDNHRIRFLNKAAEEMFGHARGDVLGQDLGVLLRAEHREEHRGHLQRYLEEGGTSAFGKTLESIGQRNDGRLFPLEKSYSYHRIGGQRFFTAIIRDVSRRKELEQQIRFTERLADVGKAVTHVVHEIRNPLMLIGGFLQQLARSTSIARDEKSRHKLGIIAEEIRRLEELLQGILLLRRPTSASRKRSVDANVLVHEVCQLFEPMCSRQRVTLELQLTSQSLAVEADPDQIKQALLNLLQNALDAIGDSGTIIIKSKALLNLVQITIEDSGPGIPEEMRARVFDPFFTTKAHGTGLGLAITRNIIQDHSGSIRLDCDLQRGAVFIIELPLRVVEPFEQVEAANPGE